MRACGGPRVGDHVFGQIKAEWERTNEALLAITGQTVLLGKDPDLAAAIKGRLPTSIR